MRTIPDSPPLRYSNTTRVLHWVSAIMILSTIPIGAIMLREGLERSTQDLLFILHKNGGVIIFALVLARLAWRLVSPPPPLPASIPDWQHRAARLGHMALYAMLVVMSVSGYVRVRAGGFPVEMLDAIGAPTLVPRSEALADFAQSVHGYARFVLVALIVVHVGAALMHMVRRDGVMRRIWPPVGG
ncbi:MAG: cytochrome b [Rhodobacteraceae bacterium]|nr:MAG: cytochrome b [Paracoccaceae bacterium]